MKKIFFLTIIALSFIYSTRGQIIMGTKYSYKNIGNDYTFYLLSYFSLGAPGSCPKIGLVQTRKSNDTIYVHAYYNIMGAWTLLGGTSYDSVKYTNTYTGINYFTVTTNFFADPSGGSPEDDTVRNLYDTTFVLSSASIAETRANRVLSIFPNPAQQTIHLATVVGACAVSFYNPFGQIILHQEAGLQQPIDVSSLASGLYFVVLYDQDKNKIGLGRFYKE